jgi:hypothetical protein
VPVGAAGLASRHRPAQRRHELSRPPTWRLTFKDETIHETEDLTNKLLDIKREKGWTRKHICEKIGGYRK